MWPFKRRASASSDAPAAKRARGAGSGDAADSSANGSDAGGAALVTQELHDTQLELQLLDERCAEEQIAIQQRYDQLRRTHFDKRGALLQKIPQFWKAALCAHPLKLVHPAETEALEHITEFDLRENLDNRGSFEVRVQFAENPLFKERSVTKRVTFHETFAERVEPAKLTFVGSRGAALRDAVANVGSSVIGWLMSSKSTGIDTINSFSDVLRRDLWQDPIPYFLARQDQLATAAAASASAGAGGGAAATGDTASSSAGTSAAPGASA